jgi:hypothetical protein
MRRPRSSITYRLAAFLFVGVAVNVGVALYLTWHQPEPAKTTALAPAQYRPHIEQHIRTRVSVPEAWPEILRRYDRLENHGTGWRRHLDYGDSAMGAGQLQVEVISMRVGWPFPALAGESHTIRIGGTITAGGSTCLVLPPRETVVGPLQSGQRLMPVHPEPAGFLANTLLFAVAAWLPFATLALHRSISRRRRRRCASCGYLIQSSPRCPECGLEPRVKRRVS